jgi:hypothetical protein
MRYNDGHPCNSSKKLTLLQGYDIKICFIKNNVFYLPEFIQVIERKDLYVAVRKVLSLE